MQAQEQRWRLKFIVCRRRERSGLLISLENVTTAKLVGKRLLYNTQLRRRLFNRCSSSLQAHRRSSNVVTKELCSCCLEPIVDESMFVWALSLFMSLPSVSVDVVKSYFFVERPVSLESGGRVYQCRNPRRVTQLRETTQRFRSSNGFLH